MKLFDRLSQRREIAKGNYPGRVWVGVNEWNEVIDQNGYHRCAIGKRGWDGMDLSCGLGPMSGRHCEPTGYKDMFKN